MWRLRTECQFYYPESLPKLLFCVQWNKHEDVAQVKGARTPHTHAHTHTHTCGHTHTHTCWSQLTTQDLLPVAL